MEHLPLACGIPHMSCQSSILSFHGHYGSKCTDGLQSFHMQLAAPRGQPSAFIGQASWRQLSCSSLLQSCSDLAALCGFPHPLQSTSLSYLASPPLACPLSDLLITWRPSSLPLL
ncbi:hypothetical protein GOP47_0016099 [Adiantum capillus-veneris]|uniref:Uncharacterized protein n=1 Tax=Adiantum capillus-veneris TaxID=13818 RepID=A0A9D4UM21_ADICA|nr:hypothetical protein GOP47_0016099 [Adiantum capillus-veneris]